MSKRDDVAVGQAGQRVDHRRLDSLIRRERWKALRNGLWTVGKLLMACALAAALWAVIDRERDWMHRLILPGLGSAAGFWIASALIHLGLWLGRGTGDQAD